MRKASQPLPATQAGIDIAEVGAGVVSPDFRVSFTIRPKETLVLPMPGFGQSSPWPRGRPRVGLVRVQILQLSRRRALIQERVAQAAGRNKSESYLPHDLRWAVMGRSVLAWLLLLRRIPYYQSQ